jgi:DHA1 family inner membrane transport protein
VILATLSLIGFCFSFSILLMTPVLLQVAAEFDVSIGTAGLASAAFAVPVALLALVVGAFADRHGRKRFLVAGTATLGAATLAAAAAPTFESLLVARFLGGVGAGLCASTLLAAVTEMVPYERRGTAIAWLSAANATANIVGIPLAGILAEATSWRVSVALVGIVTLLAVPVLVLLVPRSVASAAPPIRTLYARVLAHRPALLLLGVGFCFATPWAMWSAYVVTFFQTRYDLAQGLASTLVLSGGIGMILGSQLAGRAAVRMGYVPILSACILGAGALLGGVAGLPLPLVAAVCLNMLIAAFSAGRIVTHQALMSEQVPSARATLLSISSATMSAATAVGAMLGGVILDVAGFWLMGVFAVIAMLSARALLTAAVAAEPTPIGPTARADART